MRPTRPLRGDDRIFPPILDTRLLCWLRLLRRSLDCVGLLAFQSSGRCGGSSWRRGCRSGASISSGWRGWGFCVPSLAPFLRLFGTLGTHSFWLRHSSTICDWCFIDNWRVNILGVDWERGGGREAVEALPLLLVEGAASLHDPNQHHYPKNCPSVSPNNGGNAKG